MCTVEHLESRNEQKRKVKNDPPGSCDCLGFPKFSCELCHNEYINTNPRAPACWGLQHVAGLPEIISPNKRNFKIKPSGGLSLLSGHRASEDLGRAMDTQK